MCYYISMDKDIKDFLNSKYKNTISFAIPEESDFKSIKQIANQQREFLPALMNYNLKDGLKTDSLYVAKQHNEIIGFIRWHPRKDGTQTIHEIAVKKGHEGKGIGKKLFQLTPEPIQLKVTEDNKQAIEFYKSQGLQFDSVYKGRKRDLLVFKSSELLKPDNKRKTRQKI